MHGDVSFRSLYWAATSLSIDQIQNLVIVSIL